MCSVKLKILNYFLCVLTHNLWYLGPVSSDLSNVQMPVKEVYINRFSEKLDTRMELKTLDYFQCFASYALWCLGPFSPHCFNAQTSVGSFCPFSPNFPHTQIPMKQV